MKRKINQPNATFLDDSLHRGIEYRARQTLSLTRVSGRQRHKLLRGRQIGFVVKNKEQTRKTNQKQKEMKYNGGL
jgi:hypothetical protein